MKIFLQMLTLGIALFPFGQGLRAGVLEDVMKGKATVIDLTYPLNEKNAYWPVGPYTPFKYEVIANLHKDKVFSGKYSTPEHLGTHIDAPNHFEEGLPSVDQIPFEQLIGTAVVIDITEKVEKCRLYPLHHRTSCCGKKIMGRYPKGQLCY